MMEMRSKRTLAGAALAFLAACASGPRLPVPHPALDEDVKLAVGQTAVIAGEPLTVRFDRVVEDSRCPTNVQCVRAGEAKVAIVMHAATAQPQEVVLATEPAQPQSATYGAYEVRLVSLEPRPRTDVPTPAYLATLRVTRH
jgi:hypothetical protein